MVAGAIVDNFAFDKTATPARGHMYSSGDITGFPTALSACFHCSSTATKACTRFILGALQQLWCWITCWACSGVAVTSCCCMTTVLLLLWPDGSVLLRGAGGSLLEGAGGQRCRSQLGGAVCRHRGGHWAMLPARGLVSPHELSCPTGALPPANSPPIFPLEQLGVYRVECPTLGHRWASGLIGCTSEFSPGVRMSSESRTSHEGEINRCQINTQHLGLK